MIIVATTLPEARVILSGELNACNPFGAFPEIEPGYYQPNGPSMIWR